MTTLHKAAQMALDALEWCEPAGTVGYGGVAIRSAAITALREALAAPPAAPAPAAPVPDGWVMVPREPTPEMIAAMPYPANTIPTVAAACYRAMIAAHGITGASK